MARVARKTAINQASSWCSANSDVGTVVGPIISAAIDGFRESGILVDDERHRFDAALAELERRRESYWPDVVILVITAAFTWAFIMGLADDTMTWMKADPNSGASFTVAGWWYLLVSSPILQILLYRWLWRLAVWGGFLYRFSRIRLALEPTHPDLAGGLGALKYTQGAFTVIFVAFATMFSVSVAQEIMYTDLTLSETRPLIIGLIVVFISVASLPLLFFASQLIDARRRGLRAYGALHHKLSRAFGATWVDKSKEDLGDELLHAVDPSAMADYSAVYGNVKNMHIVPASLRSYTLQAAILAVPFLPLILIEIPLSDLLARLLNSLL